jgi:hypothetical protein
MKLSKQTPDDQPAWEASLKEIALASPKTRVIVPKILPAYCSCEVSFGPGFLTQKIHKKEDAEALFCYKHVVQ